VGITIRVERVEAGSLHPSGELVHVRTRLAMERKVIEPDALAMKSGVQMFLGGLHKTQVRGPMAIADPTRPSLRLFVAELPQEWRPEPKRVLEIGDADFNVMDHVSGREVRKARVSEQGLHCSGSGHARIACARRLRGTVYAPSQWSPFGECRLRHLPPTPITMPAPSLKPHGGCIERRPMRRSDLAPYLVEFQMCPRNLRYEQHMVRLSIPNG